LDFLDSGWPGFEEIGRFEVGEVERVKAEEIEYVHIL
jgi:hypothetical protein